MQTKEIHQQLIPPQTTPQQMKTIIFIENLDQGISEDYLYRKFKEVGEIQSLKITKDKITQKSKGQAFITFAHPDSAEEARKKFNSQVFIRNTIRVKPYFNYHIADKKANIFINNLSEDADILELEQEFSRFGTVLSVDIHRDSQGKQLNYGYVQFEKKEDADNLIKRIMNHPITHKGKLLKLEQFKAQSERKIESSSIYLRAFAKPLQQKYFEKEKVVRAIEYGWSLIIKEYFTKHGQQVKDCFVKIDFHTRQPWTMISFESSEQARDNLEICEQQRTHPCINSGAHHALELINKHGPPVNSDASQAFTVAEITQAFKEMAQDHNDTFKGESENFFYNMVYSKNLNPDDRLILVQNIKEDVTKEQIQEFLSRFGKVIRLTIRKTKNPRFQVQQCFVHYQTMEDSKRARSEIYDDKNEEIIKIKKAFFKDGHVMMNILLSKSMRKEFKEIKKQSQSIFQNPGGRQLLQPPFGGNLPMMPPQMPFPPGGQGMRQMPPRGGGRGGPFPMVRPQNLRPPPMNTKPIQLLPNKVNPPQSFIHEFSDYALVQSRMEDFLKIPVIDQRNVLGNLLFQKVFDVVKDKEATKKVVGMLIDPSQFEIGDILNMFEDSQELQTYIDEGLSLIKEDTQK
ncbi:unnamed protein product (macronuclear) [Paramecium tetraurelia]|uniref:Polyadenylate-binding protein n=1 Tax=Paramecium tetraurelia TaxID=5888 RepID=A0E9I9_PARTE|nr:uncharacterized protein GSPATT00024687001 [Paramecium tetraurelia]CAK91956.1 unnamed protein product [Paramecium tetraurelia]|eukprot:XP_001459353.1 hypothetical protein (macronuclear) [Paramecium tetraurelia strain d4-2]